MARKCDISGTSTARGGNRKHRRGRSGAGGHWRFKSPRTTRAWKPNLRKVRVVYNGQEETVRVAMKIYKKLRKGESVNGYTLAPSYQQLQKAA
jgi:ribosomal protein L28